MMMPPTTTMSFTPSSSFYAIMSRLTGENGSHLVFMKFFKHYRCYDLIPVSAKLIVLDTQLLVKKAFHALVSNGEMI